MSKGSSPQPCDNDDDHQCVVCGEPRSESHKCTKASEARFNRRLAGRLYAHRRKELRRYGVGHTYDQKFNEAVEVFYFGGIDG